MTKQAPKPVVVLTTGDVSPAEIKSHLAKLRRTVLSGFSETDLTHIREVLKGKAKNGDIQATRMVFDLLGIGRPSLPECEGDDDEPRHRNRGNVVQVNVGDAQQDRVRIEAGVPQPALAAKPKAPRVVASTPAPGKKSRRKKSA